LGSAEERQEFETQQLVVNLKAGIERNTRLHCWLDIERMGAGEAIREQVYDGVCHADMFLCCLTDAYLRSRNCMMELDVAIKQAKQIVPLLLPGYGSSDAHPPWPPPGMDDSVQKVFARLIYTDLRTEERRADNFARLSQSITEYVRRVREGRKLMKVGSELILPTDMFARSAEAGGHPSLQPADRVEVAARAADEQSAAEKATAVTIEGLPRRLAACKLSEHLEAASSWCSARGIRSVNGIPIDAEGHVAGREALQTLVGETYTLVEGAMLLTDAQVAVRELEKRFYFVPAEEILRSTTKTLPRMQDLRVQGRLATLRINVGAAMRGEGTDDKLFVSHRWELPSMPDSEGAQFLAIKSYLQKHRHIKWVWYDFWCMPQKGESGLRTARQTSSASLRPCSPPSRTST